MIGALEFTALFYLVDILGASPTTAGVLLFVSQGCNAVMDLAIGRAIDRAGGVSRTGLFLSVGGAMACVGFILLYGLPLLKWHDLGLAACLVFAVRLATSLLDIPHNALLTRVAASSRSRTSVAVWKFGFSTLGLLFVSVLLGMLQNPTHAERSEQGVLVFGIVCGVLGPLSVLTSWWVVRHAEADGWRRPSPSSAGTQQAASGPGVFSRLWRRDYGLVLAVITLTPFSTHLFIKSLMFEATHVLGDPSAAQTLLAAMMLGQMAGVALWSWWANRLEKAQAARLAFAIVAVGFVLFFWLGPVSMFLACGAMAMTGVGASGALSLIWSMAADCCDAAYADSGRRDDATAFGMLSFAGKVGSGLGGLMLGWWLSTAGYAPGVAPGATTTAIIHALNSLAPAIAAIACAVLLGGYRLSHARHEHLTRMRRIA